MIQRSGLFSSSANVLRLVLFIVAIILIAFFTIRFFRNRQISQRDQQATNQTASSDTQTTEDDTPSNAQQPAAPDSQSQVNSVDDGTEVSSTIPDTGPSAAIVITALLYGGLSYLLSLNLYYRKLLGITKPW